MPVAGFLGPPFAGSESIRAVFMGDNHIWCLDDYVQCRQATAAWLGWTPTIPDSSTLELPGCSILWKSPNTIELTAVAASRATHWQEIRLEDRCIDIRAKNMSEGDQCYLASTMVRSGLVAAVTPTHIELLRAGAKQFTLQALARVSFPNAVSCFAYPRMRELIVVCSDGSISLVPLLS
jgi:hypothetical protein